jgi:hypothetical protein
MKRVRGEDTPGDRVSRALAWLEENPEAPLRRRACFALLVACGGDESREATFEDVAEVLDADVDDVFEALWSLMDEPVA